MIWRQSSDGKLVTFGQYYSNSLWLHLYKWTNPTTASALYFGLGSFGSGPQWPTWLRLEDDGVNRKAYVSNDGTNWLLVHTVGRTDFLTADEVGFAVQSGGAGYPAGIKILSWVEA